MPSNICQHTTLPISSDDFEIGRMEPLSYSQEEISKAIVHNVNRFKLGTETARQEEALLRYKHQGSWSIADPENYEDFWKWFGFINDIFFGGLLTDFCRMEILEHKIWMRFRGSGSACQAYSDWYLPGQDRDPRHKLETPYCLLVFAPPHELQPTDRIQLYIRVLCHELLHSIFQIYTCACQHSLDRKWEAGHDIHWQAAAFAIERCWAFGRMSIDLLRDASMASDVFHGEDLPNEATLRRLDMDIGVILSNLRLMRKIKSERKTEKFLIKIGILPQALFKGNKCLRADWVIEG